MLLTVAVVASVFAGALGAGPCGRHPVCNLKELERAQKSFINELGIPDYGIKQYAQLQDTIEDIFAETGADGLGKVCASITHFKQQFTNMRDYNWCLMNPMGLVSDENCTSTGYTEKQARGYARVFASLDFACGVGYSHYLNGDNIAGNLRCISNVFKNDLDFLHKCQDDFDNQLDVHAMDSCPYISESAHCYQVAFSKCGGQGEWFGCEFQRTGLQIAYGNCGADFCTYIAR